jgi:hypothetical protein
MRTDPVNTVRIFRTMPPSARWGQNTAYDEDQALRIELGLILHPRGARRGDVRPILLGCANAFF